MIWSPYDPRSHFGTSNVGAEKTRIIRSLVVSWLPMADPQGMVARHAEQLKIMRANMKKNQDEAKEANDRLRIEREDRRETERTLQQVMTNVQDLTCTTASQQSMMHRFMAFTERDMLDLDRLTERVVRRRVGDPGQANRRRVEPAVPTNVSAYGIPRTPGGVDGVDEGVDDAAAGSAASASASHAERHTGPFVFGDML